MTYRAPKGTEDVFAPESRVWRRAERVFYDLAERYGYELILTPVFETTELFERGVGEDTEVVEKQMYTFVDKGGRSVTLRPEATAGVVRAFIEAGGVATVAKTAMWGPMFRYEQPQKGRKRQFHQADIEYLGEESADADVEVIELGYRYLEELGVASPTVLLNSIGDPADRIEYRQILTRWLEERASAISAAARRRISGNPLRVLDSKADSAVVADAPAPVDHLGDEAHAHFAAVRRGLDRRRVPYAMAPRLVRGLDYYNRTVFEYQSPSFRAAQASLGGGGRYDPLFELLGGKPTPAVGLAMGIDRIVLAATADDGPVLDVFVVIADEELRAEAVDLVGSLRSRGLRADVDLGTRSVKAQFRAADRRGAGSVAVVGEEWHQGSVTMRDMGSGEQATVPIEEIAPWIAR
jgi:histidyl-tRNA synthetase